MLATMRAKSVEPKGDCMDALETIAAEPLDHTSDKPLYQQLKERILQVIAAHAIKPDTPLPGELDLCEALGLSRATVRRCFQDLVNERRVIRRRGQGTFIKEQTDGPYADIALNFSARMREAGKVPSSRILSFRRLGAPVGVAASLRVEPDAPVWEIRRLRLADGHPMECNFVYIPCELCTDLSRDDLEHSLYSYMARTAGVLPASFDAFYEAVNLDKREAQLLGQQTGKAALRILRTTFDQHGHPFEAAVVISCDGHAKLHVQIGAEKTSFSAIAS